MKKATNFLITSALLFILTAGCTKDPSKSNDPDLVPVGPYENPQGFKLKGSAIKGFTVSAPVKDAGGIITTSSKLMDGYGNEFVIRGINYVYAWAANSEDPDTKGYLAVNWQAAIPAIAATGANSIRFALGNTQSYRNTVQTSAQEVADLITWCRKYHLIAIFEIHNMTGNNEPNKLLYLVTYWTDILAPVLIGNEDIAIINIANEWGDYQLTGEVWANTYQTAISNLRKAGLNHTLMIDAPNYAADYKSVIKYGPDVLASDPNNNTMFSLHMYGAGSNLTNIQNAIDGILGAGLSLCVGEYGNKQNSTDVPALLSYCKEKKVGWLAWSWNGNNPKDTKLASLDIASDMAGTTLSDFGISVVNGTDGLQQPGISTISTVFTADLGIQTPNKISLGPLHIDFAYASSYAAYGMLTCAFGQRVKLFNSDGTDFSSVSAGKAVDDGTVPYFDVEYSDSIMIIGAWSSMKNIVSGLEVNIEYPGAFITGNISELGSDNTHYWLRDLILTDAITELDQDNGAPYTGTIMQNLSNHFTSIGSLDISANQGDFTYDDNKPVILNSGDNTYAPNIKSLDPGSYGSVSIGSGSTFTFSAGTYNFKSFTIDKNVELYFPTDGKVIINIWGGLSMGANSKMLSLINGEKKGANPENILVVCGGMYPEQTAELSDSLVWRGTLVTPNSRLTVLSNNPHNHYNPEELIQINPTNYQDLSIVEGNYYGAFYAKYLYIYENKTLHFVPFDWSSVQ